MARQAGRPPGSRAQPGRGMAWPSSSGTVRAGPPAGTAQARPPARPGHISGRASCALLRTAGRPAGRTGRRRGARRGQPAAAVMARLRPGLTDAPRAHGSPHLPGTMARREGRRESPAAQSGIGADGSRAAGRLGQAEHVTAPPGDDAGPFAVEPAGGVGEPQGRLHPHPEGHQVAGVRQFLAGHERGDHVRRRPAAHRMSTVRRRRGPPSGHCRCHCDATIAAGSRPSSAAGSNALPTGPPS